MFVNCKDKTLVNALLIAQDWANWMVTGKETAVQGRMNCRLGEKGKG